MLSYAGYDNMRTPESPQIMDSESKKKGLSSALFVSAAQAEQGHIAPSLSQCWFRIHDRHVWVFLNQNN